MAQRAGACLAGSVWQPAGGATAALLMHPGSGPSDRNNDVLFPPIRDHLLRSDIAVCSFDKRGVGGSSGRWQDAGIVEQADDLLACLDVLRGVVGDGLPVGLFGHSQGGWVVVEAASRGTPGDFVITNSGPGVSPYQQERFSLMRRMSQQRLDHEAREAALAGFDVVATLMREQLPLEQARRPLERAHADYGEIPGLESMFDDPAVWAFLCKIFHYDPAAALSHVTVPLLALFGADDDITPVDASVAGYRRAVRPDLLEVTVFPGADHRLQHGEAPTFVDGYLDSLTAFIRRIVQPG